MKITEYLNTILITPSGREMSRGDYITWMTNSENSHNCKECPEKRCFKVGYNQLPCGAYNCWVNINIKEYGENAAERWKAELD